MKTIIAVCLACTATLPLSAGAADEAEILELLDSRFSQTVEISSSLWEFAELGYQETASSGLLQTTLAAEGFRIEAGVAGIPTAFVASYGTPGPVIGILAEYDALPGITQDSVAARSPIEDKGAGHACGHNLFAAGSVGAAIAIRHWLEDNDVPGTVRVYGTPAEEGGSGKVYMVRAGLFDDADFVLHWHPADRNSAEAYTTLANRSAR
ncbi:MAG TPA: M20/M25/M40 family metallo-hydrolase, partial [Gammaproteobacteria bacterium]|nr:M20/M25/M40 family metallo-hydrolase [Gammaproteobacteria bacterium]